MFSEVTRDILIARQTLASGDPMPQGYRLGVRAWDQAPTPDGGTTLLLTHHGTAYGATSYFAVYPEYRLAISVVMNRDANGAPLIPESAPQLESIAFRAVIARQAQQTTTE